MPGNSLPTAPERTTSWEWRPKVIHGTAHNIHTTWFCLKNGAIRRFRSALLFWKHEHIVCMLRSALLSKKHWHGADNKVSTYSSVSIIPYFITSYLYWFVHFSVYVQFAHYFFMGLLGVPFIFGILQLPHWGLKHERPGIVKPGDWAALFPTPYLPDDGDVAAQGCTHTTDALRMGSICRVKLEHRLPFRGAPHMWTSPYSLNLFVF